MANININSKVLTNLQSEDIALMINNVIDAELQKDVSQMDTALIDECVDLLIKIEQAENDKFNALIPLVSSDKFLSIINHKHSGWKRLNVFARAAVVAAVIAGSTFTVNACVCAVTDVNILGEVGEAIHDQLVEWGVIKDSDFVKDNREKTTAPNNANNSLPNPKEKDVAEKSTAHTVPEDRKKPHHPTTKHNEHTTHKHIEETTQTEKPENIPVTVPEAPTQEPTTKRDSTEEATAVTEPDRPGRDDTEKPIVFAGLRADSSNMKKDYIYNEKIDYSGLKLYAVYSDGSSKELDIEDTAHTRNVDTTKAGDFELRITYNKCTIVIMISVRPDDDTRGAELCSNEDFDYYLTDKGAYIIKYKGSAQSIVLDQIDENDVYAIGNGVFKNSNITYFASNTVKKIFDNAFCGSAELENSITPCVTYIGSNAYKDCAKLQDAIYAYNLSYIGENAYEKTSIKSLTIPDGIGKVPDYLCNECPLLEAVELGRDVTVIGRNAFNECPELTSVTGTANITRVEEAGFYEDEKLELDSNLPKLEHAGNIAFAYCKMIDFGKLSESIKYIGDAAFQYCYKLTEVNIPSSISEVPFCAFQGAHITKLTIEEGVKRIGEYAFMSTNFTDLVLPKSLESIGTYAFYSAKIRSVKGGENVTSVGSNAFYRSSRLTMVVVIGTSMYYYAVDNNITHVTLDENGAIILPEEEL
ncbi:MAG: leucine-rich repeat protein [Eubacterium sp.]